MAKALGVSCSRKMPGCRFVQHNREARARLAFQAGLLPALLVKSGRMNGQTHPRKFSQGAGSLKYHYIALIGLLVIAGGYQALVVRDISRGVLHPDRVYESPFGVSSGR